MFTVRVKVRVKSGWATGRIPSRILRTILRQQLMAGVSGNEWGRKDTKSSRTTISLQQATEKYVGSVMEPCEFSMMKGIYGHRRTLSSDYPFSSFTNPGAVSYNKDKASGTGFAWDMCLF